MYKKGSWLIVILVFLSVILSVNSNPVFADDGANNGSVWTDYNEQNNKDNSQTNKQTSDNQVTDVNDKNVSINESTDTPHSLWLDLLKMFVALILILFLIYFLLKFLNKRNKLFQQSRVLDNLGGIGLGQNRSLQIIRIGNRYYVIGVGDSIELITEIDDEETIEDLINQQGGEGNTTGFGQILSAFKKEPDNNVNDRPGGSSIQFQRLFNQELKQMKQERSQGVNRLINKEEDDRYE